MRLLSALRDKWTHDRHKKFQITITLGTIGCCTTALLMPAHGELVVIGGTITNIIWIWE